MHHAIIIAVDLLGIAIASRFRWSWSVAIGSQFIFVAGALSGMWFGI